MTLTAGPRSSTSSAQEEVAPIGTAAGRRPAAGSAEAAEPVSRPAVVVVKVEGELDVSSVSRVREHLHDALSVRPARLVVDLERCPFVDACALTMLLDVHRRAWRAGGLLTLRGCSPRVLRLLSLTGLRRVFDLADA
jgi:anti-anti-sigma factor